MSHPVRYAPPITEHVPLNSKTLCKNIARAVGGGGGGGANNMHPVNVRGGKLALQFYVHRRFCC